MLPTAVVSAWATVAHLAARHSSLNDDGASLLDHATSHGPAIAWTFFLVIVPLALAVRPRPIPVAAAVALVAGPILGPVFFAGGWMVWQRVAVAVVCVVVLAAARARSR